MTIREYDFVETIADRDDLHLSSGTRGVIVDLPEDSSVAAVEFDLEDGIEVFLLDSSELRAVQTRPRAGDPGQDE